MRSQKDETKYDEQCRKENGVLSDLVKALRAEVVNLRQNQFVIFENLIRAEDALRVYRVQHLEQSRQRAALGAEMTGFYWDTGDGWHRESERPKVRA